MLTPGTETVMQVTARLYLRDKIGKLGIAPLTSMYTFGENQPGKDDYRPEVHDSDGLSIQLGDGEWVWRPLVNPRRLLVTSFGTTNPRGFGLMQRDRSPASYEDPEALYERRPSAWIEPVGNWGAGRVELVQIPTPDETNDNIVAFWVPQALPAPGKPLDIAYKIHWQAAGTIPAGKGWVVQTRRGRGFAKRPHRWRDQLRRRFRRAGAARAGALGRGRAGDLGRRQRRGARAQSLQERGQRRLAHDRSNQAQRRRQAGRAARLPEATAIDPDRDMELHPSRRGRQAMTPPVPHPPLERSSMPAVPWAGSPFGRPLRRLLGRLPRVPRRRASDARPLMARRLVLLVLVLLGAYIGTQAMAEVLPERGAALAERGLLVLFGILFAWISAGFWTGVMGVGVLLFGRGKSPLARGLASEPVRPLDPAARTAIVMPICNEHVPTVFGGLAATIDSLVSTGESENFDVYVLSDTVRSRHPRRRARRLEPISPAASPPPARAKTRRCASTTAGASSASRGRPATSPTSAAAGAPTTATSSSSTPTAS